MPKRFILNTACAALLALGPAASLASSDPAMGAANSPGDAATTKTPTTAALAVVTSPATTPVVAGVAANDSADAPAPGEKKGNGFLRALGAPFRALAKIFGGGGGNGGRDKSANAAAKKVKPQTTAQATQATVAAQTVAVPPNAATAQPPVQVLARPAESPRPFVDELRARVERNAAAPGEWKPFIEGVPRDALSQGRALMRAGFYGEAIAELSVAATIGPDLVEAHRLLGETYDRLGSHSVAREHYGRALSFAPRDSRVLHALGHSLYLDNRFREALKPLKQAARAAPNDPAVAHSIGLVQFRLHKFDGALKTFARVEGEYAARLRVGEMFEQSGFDARALKQYEAAIRLQPSSVVALERLANVYQRTGQMREAEAVRLTIRNVHAGGGG